MFGYVRCRPDGRAGVTLERTCVGGADFFVLTAAGKSRRAGRRVRRAVEEMRSRGVRRWVAEPGWPEEWSAGLTPVGEQGLRRALLEPVTAAVCRARGLELSGASVLLSAPRADADVLRAAALLAARCRRLRLDVPGGEELERWLLLRWGLSAGGTERPALQVCFGACLPGIPAVLLGPECERRQRLRYRLPRERERTLRPYALTPQLVAALWEAGVLPPEEIRVEAGISLLDTGEETHYNAM